MKRKGFTLIELIVVIAIIVILAGILYPVFQRTHCNERRPACQANLKQIGMAMVVYTQDYDNKYPPAINSRHGLAKPVSWAGLLYPYLKTTQLFQCPSDEAANNAQKSSYAFNAWLDERATKHIKARVSTIINFEVLADPNNWTQTGTGPQAVSARIRHLEGANYAFADGHVKYLKPEQITADKPNGKNYTFAIK